MVQEKCLGCSEICKPVECRNGKNSGRFFWGCPKDPRCDVWNGWMDEEKPKKFANKRKAEETQAEPRKKVAVVENISDTESVDRENDENSKKAAFDTNDSVHQILDFLKIELPRMLDEKISKLNKNC